MHLFARIADALGHLNNKYHFILLYFRQHFNSNGVRDIVVPKVVLGYLLMGMNQFLQLVAYLFFKRIQNIIIFWQ